MELSRSGAFPRLQPVGHSRTNVMRANENDIAWSNRPSNAGTPRSPPGKRPVAASPRSRVALSGTDKASRKADQVSIPDIGREPSDVLVQTGNVVKLLHELSEDELRGELERRQRESSMGEDESLHSGSGQDAGGDMLQGAYEADNEDPDDAASRPQAGSSMSEDMDQVQVAHEGVYDEDFEEQTSLSRSHEEESSRPNDNSSNANAPGVNAGEELGDAPLSNTDTVTTAMDQKAAVIQGAWRVREARQVMETLRERAEQLKEQEDMIQTMNELSKINEALDGAPPQKPLSTGARRGSVVGASGLRRPGQHGRALASPKHSPKGAVMSPTAALKRAGQVTGVPRTNLSPTAARKREEYSTHRKEIRRDSDDDTILELDDAAPGGQPEPVDDNVEAQQGDKADATQRRDYGRRRSSGSCLAAVLLCHVILLRLLLRCFSRFFGPTARLSDQSACLAVSWVRGNTVFGEVIQMVGGLDEDDSSDDE